MKMLRDSLSMVLEQSVSLRVIEFRDTLPMNATGKILKIELRA